MTRLPLSITRVLLSVGLLAAALPASAHPGHDAVGSSLFSGFTHPLLGVDHLVAMLLVGVWSAQLGGRARVQLPLVFVALMLVGAGVSFAGFGLAQAQAGIVASLLILGLFGALALRVPAATATMLVAGFALCHGLAHGAELPASASALRYALGFTLSSVLLQLAGQQLPASGLRLARAAGIAGIATGLVYAVAG